LHVGAVFSALFFTVTAKPVIPSRKNTSMVGEIIVKSNDSLRLTGMAQDEDAWRF
jgi:hypothetical protein